jgi:uncharacterized protein
MPRWYLWLVLCCVPLTACNALFYMPSRRLYDWPVEPFRNVSIATADGEQLHGWLFAPQGPEYGTVVQFHGNAGNITAHFQSLVWLTHHGYRLLTFDYRGYGRSTGRPSPLGVEQDALAVMRYAEALPTTQRENGVVYYGQSLGGAILLHAYPQLEHQHVHAVVVEGTFHSYQEIAASVLFRHWLLLPMTGFAYATVSDVTSPASAVSKIAPTPLLIIHGAKDPVVPLAFGRALERLAAQPHEFWIVPNGGHIDALRQPAVRQRLLDYLERSRQM